MMISAPARDSLLLIHAQTLELQAVSCEQLESRGPDLVNWLGYRAGGVVKGSQAARLMSQESRMRGGGCKSLGNGGICAALQSIGALGYAKPVARANVRRALQSVGLLRNGEYDDEDEEEVVMIIQLPSYFKISFGSPPILQNDYALGGYNVRMAERMLNDSVHPFCKENQSRCNLNLLSNFKVTGLHRIENVPAFERYKKHELRVAEAIERRGVAPVSIQLPEWLQKLSLKNGLSSEANAVYLLHGTKMGNIDSIVKEGLKTKFSLDRTLSYGKGLYFTDNACKANQFAQGNGAILVCRVVLGRTEVLPDECRTKLFPSYGYDSAFAQKRVTNAPDGYHQLHNEFIVYDDCACYPEFVIRYSLS